MIQYEEFMLKKKTPFRRGLSELDRSNILKNPYNSHYLHLKSRITIKIDYKRSAPKPKGDGQVVTL